MKYHKRKKIKIKQNLKLHRKVSFVRFLLFTTMHGYNGYQKGMSKEIQYRKTISHTLVLHDPLSQGHILPMSKGKWLWWQSRCFSVRSFCKMLHKMFAEIRGKRREWPSPSLTIYATHLCGMSAIEKCTAIALRRTSFSSDPQTVNNVSQEN